MKKTVAVCVIALCITVFAGAQEREDGLKLSAEFKTGIFWYQLDREGDEEGPYSQAFMHNSEDQDLRHRQHLTDLRSHQGRLRLNFQYDMANIGTKFRFETTRWPVSATDAEAVVTMPYAFVYGHFFDDNLKVSAGKMGDSPWAAGGPDLWTELDTTIGMRFEFIPQFIPLIPPGSLNLGFVFNGFNGAPEQMEQPKVTLGDMFSESVIGAAYTHDYFHVRLAYRFDSLADGPANEQFVYRAEERVLSNFLPGFQIWANGFWSMLNPRRLFYEEEQVPDDEKLPINAINWLYLQYDHPSELNFTPLNLGFITRLRLGYEVADKRGFFFLRPDFFVKMFNDLLRVGLAFEYLADVGDDKFDATAPYLRWYLEPQIRLNFAPDTYVALVYRYSDDYEVKVQDQSTGYFSDRASNAITHSFNLRILFTF